MPNVYLPKSPWVEAWTRTQANIAQAVRERQADHVLAVKDNQPLLAKPERCIQGKTTLERRFYLSSLPANAERLLPAIRAHRSVENRLHWCMDVAFADDQMRARSGHAAHNLAILKQITLNLIRLDPIKRKGGIKARRFIAATSDLYREHLLGLA